MPWTTTEIGVYLAVLAMVGFQLWTAWHIASRAGSYNIHIAPAGVRHPGEPIERTLCLDYSPAGLAPTIFILHL